MADLYCDMDGGGSDTAPYETWAKAHADLSVVIAAAAAGDSIWVQGVSTTFAVAKTITGPTDESNPAECLGVKNGTAAEPPVQADLIPGLRTGDATRAYKQTAGNAPPKFTTTTSGDLITINGYINFYGIAFEATADRFELGGAVSHNLFFEECSLTFGSGGSNDGLGLGTSGAGVDTRLRTLNCLIAFTGGAASSINPLNRGFDVDFISTEFTFVTALNSLVGAGASTMPGRIRFIGCDLSAHAGSLVAIAGANALVAEFWNCKTHASASMATGTTAGHWRVEAHLSEPDGTPKTSGQSRQSVAIATSEGDIVEETTAVRTGGASDGATGAHALAFTPAINQTRDNVLALVGPWMGGMIAGDGTSKTLTVYIANDGAADYNDDDVWLEVLYPSEAGGAKHDFNTNQMQLLGTPTAVTDDAGSIWGTGGDNHQKLQITIAPDYTGAIMARVMFAKNFGASPETLYVDPLLEVA